MQFDGLGYLVPVRDSIISAIDVASGCLIEDFYFISTKKGRT